MAHWSECRVPWLGSSRPEEEIICDLASGMLACELRIPTDVDQVNQHAAYLQSWLQLMEDDENWIYKASSQASTVCDFLLRFLNQPHVPDEDCPF